LWSSFVVARISHHLPCVVIVVTLCLLQSNKQRCTSRPFIVYTCVSHYKHSCSKMGNSQAGPADDMDPFDGIETLGYRVLGVQPDSPASEAGLVSFLDFLVGAQGRLLLGSGEDLKEGEEYDDVDLPALLQQHKGQPVEFCKWNDES
jgi:hypothetical protein